MLGTTHKNGARVWRVIAVLTCVAVHAQTHELLPQPRGQNIIRAGGCESESACGYEAFPVLGDLVQLCEDDSWLGLAWPHPTAGATIHSIQMTLRSVGNGGDLYLMGDGGGCPDTTNILWEGCCAIRTTGPEPAPLTFCTGPIQTTETTWVVLVPRGDPAVAVAFDQFPQGLGHGSVNLEGGADCDQWNDLTNYLSPYGETYGGCYCVSLNTEPCESQSFSCGGEEPVLCEPVPTCDGDTNRDGFVDPLDVGYVLARFGADICADGNCNADANCDGTIDPLDAGYALARLAQCNPAPSCELHCN